MKTWTEDEVQSLLDSIVDGGLDAHKDRVRRAFEQRKTIVDAKAMATVKIGDRVMFNDNIRPKFLRGMFGAVTKVNETSVTVDLEAPAGSNHPAPFGRFGSGKGVRCPIGLVTVQ